MIDMGVNRKESTGNNVKRIFCTFMNILDKQE